MPSIYKYLPSKYVEAFVARGEILFRTLSYFRNFEELHVRGDRNEGKHLYRPAAGLQITMTSTGEEILLPWSFESSVREREIFVFCLSLTKSEDLAREFKADVCVEIRRPDRLLAGIRGALKRRPRIKNKQLIHGPVTYYSPDDQPNAVWAVPDQVTMRKTIDYQRQQEFRIAYSKNDAFRVNNVATQLSAIPDAQSPSLDDHPKEILKIGAISSFCSIHAFS